MLKVISILLRLFWAFISVAIVVITPSEKDNARKVYKFGPRYDQFGPYDKSW